MYKQLTYFVSQPIQFRSCCASRIYISIYHRTAYTWCSHKFTFSCRATLPSLCSFPYFPWELSVGDGHRAFAWPVWLAPPPPRCDAPLNGISFGNELTSWFHFSDCRRTRTGLAVCRVCCHRCCCCCCCCWMRLYLRHCGSEALRGGHGQCLHNKVTAYNDGRRTVRTVRTARTLGAA